MAGGSDYHTSVLLHETLEWLQIEAGKEYIDATLGGGGHTAEILRRGGRVLGIDQDQEAINEVEKNFKFEILNLKLRLAKGNFKDIDSIARDNSFKNLSGIVFD